MRHRDETRIEREERIMTHAKKPRRHAPSKLMKWLNRNATKRWRSRIAYLMQSYSVLTNPDSRADVLDVCCKVRKRDRLRAVALVTAFANYECQFSHRYRWAIRDAGWEHEAVKRSPYRRALVIVARRHFFNICRKRNWF